MTTILIIEDNLEATRLLELSLGREGYQVIKAADGIRGLELAQTRLPDLILLDMMLPGLDGFEICSRLRANPATVHTPILILSAKPQEADKQIMAQIGATGYLTKPYRRAELLTTIQAALAKKPTS